MLRFLTAGESHGPALTVIVEGLPAGLAVDPEEIAGELARRRLGFGRGPRMRFERDELRLLGGVRHGRTLGSPVAIEILNSEWPKWEEEMSAAPGAPSRRLTAPRPGHADLAGMLKYGFDDARDVLERASARETAARVVAGVPRQVAAGALGVAIVSHVVRLGAAAAPPGSATPPVRPGRGRRRRGSQLRRGRLGGDGRRGARRGQGRRLPRWRRRGSGLRRARRPRQPRPLGPPARRPLGRGDHEHPGGQGRRDRRRG